MKTVYFVKNADGIQVSPYFLKAIQAERWAKENQVQYRILSISYTSKSLKELNAEADIQRQAYVATHSDGIDALLALSHDWDSYGAEPPNKTAVDLAKEIIKGFDIGPISALASVEGGVLLRYPGKNSSEVYIECYNDGELGGAVTKDGKIIYSTDSSSDPIDFCAFVCRIYNYLAEWGSDCSKKEPRISYIDENGKEKVFTGDEASCIIAAMMADTVVSPEVKAVAALPRLPEK